MQPLARDNRRPPVPPKHNAGGELPYGNDRENLLKLIQWFHQRRVERRTAEFFFQTPTSSASHDSRMFSQHTSNRMFESN